MRGRPDFALVLLVSQCESFFSMRLFSSFLVSQSLILFLECRSSVALCSAFRLVRTPLGAVAFSPWMELPELSVRLACPKVLFNLSHSSLCDSDDIKEFSILWFCWRRLLRKFDLFACSKMLFSSRRLSADGEVSLFIWKGPRTAAINGFSIVESFKGPAMERVSLLRSVIKLSVAVRGPGEYSICMVAVDLMVELGPLVSTTSPSELRRMVSWGGDPGGEPCKPRRNGRASLLGKERFGVAWPRYGELLTSCNGVFLSKLLDGNSAMAICNNNYQKCLSKSSCNFSCQWCTRVFKYSLAYPMRSRNIFLVFKVLSFDSPDRRFSYVSGTATSFSKV